MEKSKHYSKIGATRYIKSSGKEEKEVQLYITSSKENAEVIDKGVRSRWSIENNPPSNGRFNPIEKRDRF
jgi:predicted transposase YbfD/YdcC